MSIPKNQMTTLFDNLKSHTCTFLDNQSIAALLQTNKSHSKLSDLSDISRRKAEKLLFYVLNINEERKNSILAMITGKKSDTLESKAQSEAQSIILMRVTAEEFFYNTTDRKKLWSNVSPLEAAAKCGDIHLVRLLFDSIPINQKNLAIEQLKSVKASRIIKSEPGSYIEGLVVLRKAYKDYLEISTGLFPYNNDVEKFCGLLGDAQKNLSCYLLQVFCKPVVPYTPFPDFTIEPARVCVLCNDVLNIARIGGSTDCALFKGQGRTEAMNNLCGGVCGVMDSAFFDYLYSVLPRELDKIIESHVPAIESVDDRSKPGGFTHGVHVNRS